MTAMKIQVRYFAAVRELLGPGEQLTLVPSGRPLPRTVGELRAWLSTRSAAHAEALGPARKGLRTACNQTLCGPAQAIADGDEIAFFPPVTGG